MAAPVQKRQTGQRGNAVAPDHVLGHIENIAAARSAADEDGEQLGMGQCRRPEAAKLVARLEDRNRQLAQPSPARRRLVHQRGSVGISRIDHGSPGGERATAENRARLMPTAWLADVGPPPPRVRGGTAIMHEGKGCGSDSPRSTCPLPDGTRAGPARSIRPGRRGVRGNGAANRRTPGVQRRGSDP